MPDANSAPILSNPVSRYPRIAPEPAQKPKLLDRLREPIGSRHYSRRTEESYCHWVKRFIFFHNKRHPADMAEAGRHHLDESLVQKAVRDAVARAGLTARPTAGRCSHRTRRSNPNHKRQIGDEQGENPI